jgi:hypothetical protein
MSLDILKNYFLVKNGTVVAVKINKIETIRDENDKISKKYHVETLQKFNTNPLNFETESKKFVCDVYDLTDHILAKGLYKTKGKKFLIEPRKDKYDNKTLHVFLVKSCELSIYRLYDEVICYDFGADFLGIIQYDDYKKHMFNIADHLFDSFSKWNYHFDIQLKFNEDVEKYFTFMKPGTDYNNSLRFVYCDDMKDFIKYINPCIHCELPRSITHNNRFEDESKKLGKKHLKYDISFHSMSNDKTYAYAEDGRLVTTRSQNDLPETVMFSGIQFIPEYKLHKSYPAEIKDITPDIDFYKIVSIKLENPTKSKLKQMINYLKQPGVCNVNLLGVNYVAPIEEDINEGEE